jgi:glycosyltransferase involved in cell wall biosynthesis/GT2 family glycosyltransferase
LDGPAFEVCVVYGPTEDGTAEVLSEWNGRIKVGRNPDHNLSISRNIGIAMAAGEVVAFVDDDGLPEPEWLSQILLAFEDPKVAGAGGIVMDHTGARPQYLYSSANRLGNADWQRDTPADSYNFPLSFNIPYVQGTNSAFRRDALLAIGGFDEEFEFYLDETDVCCRLVDAGWLIRQLPAAVVHHKFLPSASRTADRVTHLLYPVLKNKLYFSLVNNCGHYPVRHAIEDMTAFVQAQESGLRHHIEAGRLPSSALEAFWRDVDRAWAVGLERGLSGRRRLLQTDLLGRDAVAFLEFPRPSPDGGREVVVLASQEYPPDRVGGIGRHVRDLAHAVAWLGHHVCVLTLGEHHDRIDFEDGVWVHRVVTRCDSAPPDFFVPPHIWARSATVLQTLIGIANRRHVTAVHAPIWDCEGAAVLFHGGFPLVTGLHTSLKLWLDSHPHYAGDFEYQRTFAQPVIELEKRLLLDSDAIHANSKAILFSIARAYRIVLRDDRVKIIPHGMADWSNLPATAPVPIPEGSVRLLFVGRLEARKGIDVLLDVLPRLLAGHPRLHVDIVGNDEIPGPDGRSYRVAFEAVASADVRARVRFSGEVTDEQLRGFYQACDVFVAPSRFESFGLVLVEAMMFGKPAVACRTGGMIEVAEEGRTALLAEPGDSASLVECLERLIRDPLLRRWLGSNARERYERHFTPGAMAEGVVALLRQARVRHDQRMIDQPLAGH